MAEGNDFVVGPLGRDEVTTLFSRATLPVPVLALNRGEARPPAGNASFALSPEDEGIAAADSLYDNGARHVLLVAGGEDAQRRAMDAFRETFAARRRHRRRGERGHARFRRVRRQARRRRCGVHRAQGAAARAAVVPRLALAGLAMVPKPRDFADRVRHRQGRGRRRARRHPLPDRSLGRRRRAGPAAAGHGRGEPADRARAAAKLFAFGYDAWRVCAWLEYLATANGAELPGATGTLRIDGFGNVLRTPAWAVFHADANAGG